MVFGYENGQVTAIYGIQVWCNCEEIAYINRLDLRIDDRSILRGTTKAQHTDLHRDILSPGKKYTLRELRSADL